MSVALSKNGKDPRARRNPQAGTRGEDRKPPLYVEEVVGPTGRPLRREEIRYGPSLKLDESGRLAVDMEQSALDAGEALAKAQRFLTITGDYTVTLGDAAERTIVLLDTGSVPATIIATLPPAADAAGYRFRFTTIDNTASAEVNGHGSETISGSASQSMNAIGDSLYIISTGTTWWIL